MGKFSRKIMRTFSRKTLTVGSARGKIASLVGNSLVSREACLVSRKILRTLVGTMY